MEILATRVLLLEDEPLIAMDLELTLVGEGYDVSIIDSWVEASRWLDAHKPDIAIVDIGLRDGICTDVAARLIEANVPFVVYSGDTPSFHVGTPFARGTWVSKPVPPEKLAQVIRTMMLGAGVRTPCVRAERNGVALG